MAYDTASEIPIFAAGCKAGSTLEAKANRNGLNDFHPAPGPSLSHEQLGARVAGRLAHLECIIDFASARSALCTLSQMDR